MDKLKRWTPEEDSILAQCVENSEYNKSEAFRVAATKINRTERACSFRWYQQLSNPESKYYKGVAFTSISRKRHLNNRVIVRENAVIKPKRHNLWAKIKRLLGVR